MPEDLDRTCRVRATVASLTSAVLLEWLRSQCEVVYIANATQQDLLTPNVARLHQFLARARS